MKSGDTFIIEDEDGLKEHLQVVLTDPDSNEEFVTASICSRQSRMEALVILNHGDHSFIDHESVASYRHARIRQLMTVTCALASGVARQKESVSETLLLRLRAGLLESDFVRNDVRSYFQAAGVPCTSA